MLLLLLSFFLSATEKTMAVARFFFFCGREIKLILDSEREREGELPQVSHLGFALEKRSCTQLEFARLMFDFVCVFG
jgi:hypothetical protein